MIKPRIKSLYLIILREANIVITVLTAISILYLRSAHSLWFGLGAIVATATAKILKRCIKQPRPTESTKKSFGMPSTHSSSITFFGIYLLLVCLLLPVHQKMLRLLPGSGVGGAAQQARTRNNEQDVLSSWTETLGSEGIVESSEQSPSFLNALLRLLYGLIFILIAVVVCWSRIKLGHHTHKQVVAGAAIGGLIGVVWFGIWTGFKLPKVILLGHYYYHASTSPLSTIDRNQLITIRGIGPYFEHAFSKISIMFAEAWYMRDFGLLWDGLIRPTINEVGFFLGFQDRILDNGLPPNSNLHLIKPRSDSILQR